MDLADITSDPDFDEFNNLYEFAIGSDPTSPDVASAGTPVWDTAPGSPSESMRYTRRTDAALRGLHFRFERSSDLQTWLETAVTEEVLHTADGLEEVRVTLPQTNDEQAFWRLRVSLDEP